MIIATTNLRMVVFLVAILSPMTVKAGNGGSYSGPCENCQVIPVDLSGEITMEDLVRGYGYCLSVPESSLLAKKKSSLIGSFFPKAKDIGWVDEDSDMEWEGWDVLSKREVEISTKKTLRGKPPGKRGFVGNFRKMFNTDERFLSVDAMEGSVDGTSVDLTSVVEVRLFRRTNLLSRKDTSSMELLGIDLVLKRHPGCWDFFTCGASDPIWRLISVQNSPRLDFELVTIPTGYNEYGVSLENDKTVVRDLKIMTRAPVLSLNGQEVYAKDFQLDGPAYAECLAEYISTIER